MISTTQIRHKAFVVVVEVVAQTQKKKQVPTSGQGNLLVDLPETNAKNIF